jgi:hypothetical protein
MNKKIVLVIGCGKLAQTIHLPNINKLGFQLKGICDPRKNLLKKVANHYNFEKYYSDINTALKNNYDLIFLFSSRLSSYQIILKIIKYQKKCTVFCEKPTVFNLKQSKIIQKKIKGTKLKLLSAYMSRYDIALLKFRKIIKSRKFINKYGVIKKIECSINNNKLYNKKYRYFRTTEKKDFFYNKNQYPLNLKKKLRNYYHVFINRYSHLINIVNFFYRINKIEKFIIKDIYNYEAFFKSNELVHLKFKNKKNYEIKITVFTKKFRIILILYNPTLLLNSKILIYKNNKLIYFFTKKTDVFFEEIKNIFSKNLQSKTKIADLINDFKIINSLWNKEIIQNNS